MMPMFLCTFLSPVRAIERGTKRLPDGDVSVLFFLIWNYHYVLFFSFDFAFAGMANEKNIQFFERFPVSE